MVAKAKWKVTAEQLREALACSQTIGEAAERLGLPSSSFNGICKRLKVKCEAAGGKVGLDKSPRAEREQRDLRVQVRQLQDEKERGEWRNEVVEKFDGRVMDPPRWLTPKAFKKTERTIASAMLSDVHSDEVVNPAEINYVNAYSREICDARLKRFFEKTIQIDKHLGLPSDGLVLFLGGDMISGNIHEELTITNEAPVLDTCLHLAEQICAGIALQLEHFGKVHVAGVTGNHGRIRHKPQCKNRAKDNFDWLIYKIVEKHFRQVKEVSFQIPEGSDAKVNIYSQRVQLTHGDQFHGGAGIAGIYSPIALGNHRKQKRETDTSSPYDLLIMGHWHQLKNMGDIIINGSVKGYDEYAYQKNFPFEPPQQAFWLTSQDGREIQFARIYLDSKSESWCDDHEDDDRPSWMVA